MLREEHQCQGDARHSLYHHQCHIQPFKRLLPSPFYPGDGHREDKQEDSKLCRGHDPVGLDELYARWHEGALFLDQGSVGTVLIDLCQGHVCHEDGRQELSFAAVGGLVCLQSEEYVIACLRPGVVAVTDAYHLAEGYLFPFLFLPDDLPVHVPLDDVPGTGGTVVVEEVIAVHLVLRAQVLCQGLLHLSFIVVGQVEHLLCHATAPFPVVGPEGVGIHTHQFIVCQTEHEPQDEEGLAKTEHPPVEHQVLSFGGALLSEVVPSDGGMTVQTVNFLVW